jgi:hypothetical protein
MLDIILKVLGFGGTTTIANAAVGVGNYAALATVGIWVWGHWTDNLTFSLTVGTLALIVGVAFLVIELNRRV